MKGYIMSGSISSLGLGSGVLTSDIINKLKKADTQRIITPIKTRITTNTQAQKAEKLLASLMASFKASASALSYDTIFDKLTVSSSGQADVKVDTGANVKSFTLDTKALAKKDITSFGEFNGKTSPLVGSGQSGVLDLSIDGVTHKIKYDDTTTLTTLAQSITDATGSTISASILETSAGKYSLVLSSVATGAKQAITIKDTNDGTNGSGTLDGHFDAYDATKNPNGYKIVQAATDSEFLYNGIDIKRSSNEISDLILGVHITLKAKGDSSNITIKQDTTGITDALNKFATTYNTLVQNLDDMTGKNKQTGAIGVFNGDSFVRGIKNDLNSVITSINNNNNSLVDYGIDIDRHGVMSFDKSIFESKLTANPNSVKALFTGSTDANGNTVPGWFTSIDNKVNEYTGFNKQLSNFATDLKKQGTNLETNYTKAQTSLDERYAIMKTRFIAYDGLIGKLKAKFSSLQSIISAQSSKKG